MSVRVTFVALLVLCLLGIAFAKKCYQCTTLESGCENGKVKGSKFLKDCPVAYSQSCRIIDQKIEGEKRIVRQCSNITEPKTMRCVERIGTNKIKATYCHCKKDGCNSAGHLTSFVGLSAVLAILAKLMV